MSNTSRWPSDCTTDNLRFQARYFQLRIVQSVVMQQVTLRGRAKINSYFTAREFWPLARRERRAYPARGSVRSEQRSPRPKEPAGKCEVILALPLKKRVTVHGPQNAKNQNKIMWSLDFIRRKNHENQRQRGKKWSYFHNSDTFSRERLQIYIAQHHAKPVLANG